MDFALTFLLTVTFVSVSALCSGLNVALFALDIKDLERKSLLGDKKARRALTIRRRVHFYLAGILVTNVTFASATSVVLAESISGVMAVVISTLALVIFAEITPQAIAVKNSIRAVSFFSTPIKVASYIAYPITKPLQLLLDKLVGSTAIALHTRRELGLLISEHFGEGSELDDDEVEIVQNAIQLSEKRVHQIMTPLRDVYFIYDDEVIDGKKIDELSDENWSRIPILNREKTASKRFIVLKELVDIDFDERSFSLKEVKTHRAKTVGSMTALDTMFRKFIAARSHMMIVEKDDKIVGIVTIEDLIEEIIGHEVEDEGDDDRQ